jgi:hypothetical protein
MRSQTKNKLLIATALASLLAGVGLAGAQSSNEERAKTPGAKSPTEHAAPAGPRAQSQTEPKGAQSQTEPKGAVGNHAQQGNTPNRMGQSEPKSGNAPNNRMGQSEPKSGGKADRLDAQKSGAPNSSAQTEKNKSDRNPSAVENEHGRNDRSGAAESRGKTQENRGAAENKDAKRPASASLSTEQRTKIRETVIRESNAPRLARTDLNINLSVGERIPRDRIHIRPLPLPATIVEIEPQWRGYEYFLVGDEVVVVDPDTLEIVAVIPA